jgi:predicted O-methyltransferase YrrM
VFTTYQLANKYLHYYLTASNSKGHGMHSPFVFDFILNVLNNRSGYDYPASVENLRKELLKDKEVLEIEDLGAGSRKKSSSQKSVSQLVKTALKPKKYAQLLYRLAKHYQPRTIIELGTSLGITTSYLAIANPSSQIITIEGSKAIAEKATNNFQKLGITNVQSLQGNFDDLLPSLIHQLPSIDLAYIDGNHRYQPTINYFLQLLSKSHNNTILIFDDIHWSEEMEQAWEEIKRHPSVQYTIDIFFLGFVFFRKEFKVRQDFKIRF